MPPTTDRFTARLRMLRIGCLANAILFAVFVAVPIAFFGTLNRMISADTPGADKDAIRKVLSDQVAAWNRGDLDAFMAGYWNDDALAFTSEDKVTRGWKATKERYQMKYFAVGKERGLLSFEELEVEGLSANATVVRGKYLLKLAKETATGRFTLVFRRFPDGWKITSDHTSAKCPEKN
jgi:beta-aspartyl-peptidase (threonine type)